MHFGINSLSEAKTMETLEVFKCSKAAGKDEIQPEMLKTLNRKDIL